MNARLLKISKIVIAHANFSLDVNELKLHYNSTSNSNYRWIKDIVSITEDLNNLGIKHIVHDKYIQA